MISNNKKKIKLQKIKKNISKLDVSYSHERKLRFLLDIRGYILVNKIKGNYIEFGSFLSEMQIASFLILNKINFIINFFGVDLFKKFNNFNSNYSDVKKTLEKISKKLKILKLDLSLKKSFKKINIPINISVIDCNEKVSLINSLEHSIKNIVNGGIIYIDDYFILEKKNLLLKPYMNKFLKKYKKKGEFFKTYPPFGIAVIILNK